MDCNSKTLWRTLPAPVILDWDSTVQLKYGHQEGAEIGYNPGKPGRRSVHPLLGVVAGSRFCPMYRFRSGDTATATHWHVTMRDAERWPGGRRVWLNRDNLGLGHDAVMAWHESDAYCVARDAGERLARSVSPRRLAGVRVHTLVLVRGSSRGPRCLVGTRGMSGANAHSVDVDSAREEDVPRRRANLDRV